MKDKITAGKTAKTKGKTKPITKKEEVQANPDNRIDQDFPGFPHAPAKENIINPKTEEQKKTAAVRPKR
ncbi:MAG: hypothetical protein QM768_08625 [Agriterribacter sp.]